MKIIYLMLILTIPFGIVFFSLFPDQEYARTYLENSVPHIKADVPRADNIDGTGIVVAVIDTGVDFNHPDLLGWGEGQKVIDGYNFIDQSAPPIDTDGHGTQVAGIIAADGEIVGVSPKAKILAYKVSKDGEGVSSELIARAIKMAINDGADIINISLGINVSNPKIDRAVNQAVRDGVFVVVAAGNDGPGLETIGSPGKSTGAITVGATYNNITTSQVATLKIDTEQYTVVPMIGSPELDKSITGKITVGGYGKIDELKDVQDSIVLVQRGSDVEGQMLYFSIKEKNAADAGAKAMIVYNNEEGLFFGELIHEFIEPGYEPTIPVVSMERKDGLKIINNTGDQGTIHVFHNPDFVAYFSSRGPVSPFYVKPDIMAPGAYINTTRNDATYNITSGTSYAAPHVTGSIALLLQKNPELNNDQMRSLLLTTATPVFNSFGTQFSIQEAGSGRLNLADAYNANLIIMPHIIITSTSPNKMTSTHQLQITPINGKLGDIYIKFEGPQYIRAEYSNKKDIIDLELSMTENNFGVHEGNLIIVQNQITYRIPILIHHTQGSLSIDHDQHNLSFEIIHPEQWDFAKILVINTANDDTHTITATENRNGTIKVYENTEYWIDATITSNGNISKAYNTTTVDWLTEEEHDNNNNNNNTLEVITQYGTVSSIKHVGIIVIIMATIGTAGAIKKFKD